MAAILEQQRFSNGVLGKGLPGSAKSDQADTGSENGGGRSRRSLLRRWTAAALILGTAVLAVLFVANAIKVNELLGSITSVEGEIESVRRSNEQLRAELLRLMSVEQITDRAEELGMVHPDVPPAPLPVNGGLSEQDNAH